MMKDIWTDRLSEYLDGELTHGENEALDAHLLECAECTTTLQELRAVVFRAGQVIDRPPENDLWQSIAARIAEPRGAENDDVGPARKPRSIAFSIPQLAAASIALMLVSGGTIYLATHNSEQPVAAAPGTAPIRNRAAVTTDEAVREPIVQVKSPAAENYNVAISELESALKNDRNQLDTVTVRVLEANMKVIDNAINEARAALGRDPGNLYLNRYLDESMQRKIQLLRRATGILRAQT